MTHADRFAAGLQATWGLYVAAVIILALAYLTVRAVDACKRRNPYRAPESVEAWRELHWLGDDALATTQADYVAKEEER